MAKGNGTKDDPWVLTTPPGTSEYRVWRDEGADPPALVCQVAPARGARSRRGRAQPAEQPDARRLTPSHRHVTRRISNASSHDGIVPPSRTACATMSIACNNTSGRSRWIQ
jgi:hypothetical protein